MADRTDIARAYFDGFARDDHEAILKLLTDDIVWEIHGQRVTRGKAEFDSEIVNDAFESAPTLEITRVIDAGDTVVVPHRGETKTAGGDAFRFAACDVLTFEGQLIARIDSFVVPLTE